MLGTKSLKPALEKGAEAVRSADAALKALLAVAAVTLVGVLCTLCAVLASRGAAHA